MRTIKLTIEYDGTDFSGWQTQPHKRTIQQTIEEVLARVLRERVVVIGASRTDAGVHALGQVAHLRTKNPLSCERIKVALNGLLPSDIAIRKVSEEKASFHANRSAKKKTYRYLIWNARERPALMRLHAWHVWSRLNVRAMQKGARHLLGRRNFSAFRAAKSDTKTSVRRIYRAVIANGSEAIPWWSWDRHALRARDDRRSGMIMIKVTANGFLKHMVRNIVGTLVEVGEGKRSPEDMKNILMSKDRKKAGRAAPAHGLYLVHVGY